MIILDASVLIAFLNRSDALHERAFASLLALDTPRLGFSPLTHAEVLVGPARVGTLDATIEALTALGVADLALPQDAAPLLARLRATTALKLPDCCVILTAQQSAGAILTFDDRLAAAARRSGVAVEAPAAS